MYGQVRKTKESKNNGISNSVAYAKNSMKQYFDIVDNRNERQSLERKIVQRIPVEVGGKKVELDEMTSEQLVALYEHQKDNISKVDLDKIYGAIKYRISDEVRQNPKYIPVTPSVSGRDLANIKISPELVKMLTQGKKDSSDKIKNARFKKAAHSVMDGLAGRRIFMDGPSRKRDKETRIKEFSDKELENYTAHVNKESGNLHTLDSKGIDTSTYLSHEKNGFAAFVMNSEGKLLLFNHKDGDDGVKHSSFSQGKPVIAAGELRVEDGKLTHITTHSGHYKPRPEDIGNMLRTLKSQGVDVSAIKVLMPQAVADPSGVKNKVNPDPIQGASKYTKPDNLIALQNIAKEEAEYTVKDAVKAAQKDGRELSESEKHNIFMKKYEQEMEYYTGGGVHQMFDVQVSGEALMVLPVRPPSDERLDMQGFSKSKDKGEVELDDLMARLNDLKVIK